MQFKTAKEKDKDKDDIGILKNEAFSSGNWETLIGS